MPEVVQGAERRPLLAGRTLFDYADEVSTAVPASCQRTGRCRECVVEIKSGVEALSPRTPPEAYLPEGFRLACQARITDAALDADADVEFGILRRRMRILGPSEDTHTDIDPMVTARDGIVHYGDMPVDRVKKMVLGLAVDIGTTTVVFQLIDLLTGRAVAGSAMENPQRFGGSDVMARISFDRDRPGELRDALRRQLNHELRDIYARLGIDRSEVYEAVIVANTTMRDMFFGLDVTPIGESPYRSSTEHAFREGRAPTTMISMLAHQVGLLVGPRARVIGAPLISGHVGADISADLIALDFGSRPGYSLLVDIGTNTEVVLTDGTRYIAASCPAGPAFEGGLIRFGMPGADGAIEKVRIPGGPGSIIEYDTIGGEPPAGLCGSGLVDILAELRRSGWMDGQGRLRPGEDLVMVAPERGITFSRSDASQLAQAKAANACGQRILLRRMGITADQVDHVYLAGGFANAINVENAIAIGLLADVRPERVIRAGNAALRGAEALLLSRRRREHLESIVRRIEHIELETDPDFFDMFVDGCQLHPIAA